MKTIILKFTLNIYNSEEEINKKIQEKESKGYNVTNVQLVAGNNFSKYTQEPTMVVVMQKP